MQTEIVDMEATTRLTNVLIGSICAVSSSGSIELASLAIPIYNKIS